MRRHQLAALVAVLIPLWLSGCASAPPRPDSSRFPNAVEVTLHTTTIDSLVFAVSPTLGPISPGAWSLFRAPASVDTTGDGKGDATVYFLTNGTVYAVVINGADDVPLFYAVLDDKGNVVEWAGDRDLVLRLSPKASRSDVWVEAHQEVST